MKSYEDIINLPHPKSRKHPRMSDINRAAQFAPFAALTGYDAEIEEAGRLTERQIDIEDDNKAILDHKLQLALANKNAEISIRYFVPDTKKTGGSYTYVTGTIRRLDEAARSLVMNDGTRILLDEITDIEFVL